MAMTDPLGDMFTRIRNGLMAEKDSVRVPYSKLRTNVLNILQQEGYIRGYNQIDIRTGIKEIIVELKYYEGKPVIREISRVSKPGRRVYSGIKGLGRVYNGLGVSILSTSKGIMAEHDARQQNLGGEVLCQIF